MLNYLSHNLCKTDVNANLICYKGTILKRNYRKLSNKCFVKFHGKRI